MNMKWRLLCFLFLTFALIRCSDDKVENKSNASTIFKRLSEEASGISFANNLKEDSIINYFTYPYIYMGGGVAIGDVNNDGLDDIYFTGNIVSNKLYL
ncbi:MAG: hypothetical protein AAGK97_08340, partial [Bacteroidota bacterium]